MAKKKINYWVTIIITVLVAGLIWKADTVHPIRNDKLLEFPLSFGNWSGHEEIMSDWVYNSLETPYVFLRDYRSLQYPIPVNLSIVWFDDTNIAFHAPEACMSSRIADKSTVRIKLDGSNEVEIAKLLVTLNGRQHILLYFFSVDGFITTSQSMIRLKILSRRLQLKRSSAAFIRVMAPIADDPQDTMRVLTEFLNEMYPIIPEFTYTDIIVDRK